LLDNVGHNVPQEAPRKFAQAILDLCNLTHSASHAT
jgi:hypothetical protein